MIQISNDSCTGCSKCTIACPCRLIAMQDGKAEGASFLPKFCFSCGHCQAVCPTNAIVVNGEQAVGTIPDTGDVYTQLKQLIQSNRSVRKYKNDAIPKDKLMDIIRTLDYTASAKNQQTIQYIMVTNQAKIKEFSDMCVAHLQQTKQYPEVIMSIKNNINPITGDAPYLLLAYAKKNSIFPSIDATLKMENARLLMYASGIHSCYLGYCIGFVNGIQTLKEYFGIAKDEELYCAISFGYSDEPYRNVPARTENVVRFMD